ncbi:carboxypeptidase regulatory-like domain-containing protein [bacterium]|nr:carboxypeptidase regulatory-like domain-containing protein [bacterium]
MILRRFSTRLTALLLAVAVFAFTHTTLYAKKAPEAPATLQVQQISERASFSTANKRIDSTTGETLAWYGVNQPTSQATPELAARGFVQDNAAQFGKTAVSDMRLLMVKNSRGGHHVHLQQTFQGIPVYNALFNVSMNRDRDITMVSANPYSGFSLATTSPSISSSTALTSTEVLLGAKECLEEIPVVRLNGFRSDHGSDHLAWVVNYPTLEPMGDWIVIWDATTGEHLATYDQMRYEDGTGHAFNPDPVTTAGVNYGGSYSDNNDGDNTQLNAERVEVDLLDLTFSNGAYRLTGPFVNIFNFESPNDTPVSSPTLDGFSFTRAEQGFEDVNVYYHIDTWQRHIQSLGFMDLQNNSIVADPHGLNGDDNSHYIPSQNRIAWGEGGVDDAEDADVVIHEYGHALHHAATPGNWSFDMRSISEGFGDYEAVTYSARLSDYHNTWVFNWDGHNSFWNGRTVITGSTYPGGWGNSNIYTNGTIWSNALWLMRESLDPDTADAIVFQGLYYQSASGTVVDAAQGLLQGELDLFDGRYRSEVYAALAAKGFVEPAGDITGTVTDIITEEPIAGALIELEGDDSFTTASDDEGIFGFQSIVAGDYTITISADGYGFYTDFITVTSGGLIEIDAELGNVEAELDPTAIEVTVPTNAVLDTSFTINNLGGPLEWGSKLRPAGVEPFEPFENYGEFGVQDVTGDNRIAGVTMFNGMLLVSGGNGSEQPNKIYKLTADGTLLGSFDQPSTSSSGYYDLTTDGTLIYGSEGTDIVGFDMNGVPQDTIPGPFNPNRALAYDSDHDWFWAADNSSGLAAVNRDGEVQVEIPFGTLVKGMGYFPSAPGGYKLYVSSAATGQLCRMSFFDPESGEYGGYEDLPYNATVYGSEVIAGLEDAEDLWLNAAITYSIQDGYRLTLEKLDWAVPYITLSPASGTIETQGEALISMSIDGRMLPGDVDYEVDLLIDYMNGDGSITMPITVHSQLVSAPEVNLPTEFGLDPAYPNPFNPSTVLTLHLPQASDVKVAVFDILGRQVDNRTLRAMQAGTHKIEWAAPASLASGVYFLTLDAGAGRTAAQKLVLMK